MAGDGTIIQNCLADKNGDIGISLGAGSTMNNWIAIENATNGFVISKSLANKCIARNNGGHGFVGTRSRFINCVAGGNTNRGFNLPE